MSGCALFDVCSVELSRVKNLDIDSISFLKLSRAGGIVDLSASSNRVP